MLTAVILAKNEQQKIGKCIHTLEFCDQIVVVDSGSTDDTAKIASQLKATVLHYALDGNYAQLRNWALEQIKSPWVLFVDADEEVSPALAREIKSAIEKLEYKGYLIPRVDHMWGGELNHGDVGGVKLLRLARRGAGQWVGRVHETWQVEGRVGELKNKLGHYPHPTLVEFLSQINSYSSIRASELKSAGVPSSLWQIVCYPVFKFTYLYVVRLGWLDGTAGFIHAMTMAFYSFLVRGKLWLLAKGIGEKA